MLAVAVSVIALAAAGPAAPWVRQPPIPAASGDASVIARAWRAADNRATCAPVAFNSLRFTPGVRPRPRIAYFGGGWGVAWDQPGRRSAFGIAGAGIVGTDADIRRWPTIIRWSDGSAAGYGLVAGTGPGHLAYVRVSGQRCLYNVWSNLGARHLRALLGQMRLVSGAARA